MPNILYVSLSDMHLGEEDSLLTNVNAASPEIDPTRPSPVMKQLVRCLESLVSKNENGTRPTLILNGDILELALSTTDQAAMVFERFMELVMPRNKELFERLIYIPGNHDHHLWELARETQYVEHIRNLKGKILPIPWHTTNMFVEDDPTQVPSYFLTNLVKRSKTVKDFSITAVYPNFGLLKGDDWKYVIFHHGHYIEQRYQLMTRLMNLIFPERKKPKHIWDLEAENFAWIDFFWSTMGRSGEVGRDVELIYEKMYDRKQFKALLYLVARGLSQNRGVPAWIGVTIARIVMFLFLRRTIDSMSETERAQTDDVLSQSARDGLQEYTSGPMKEQILVERERLADDVTFVFGHTHKPYQKILNTKKYPNCRAVYNTGGWVVETVKKEPIYGGAVVLVDEDLNLASLRMYNETEDPKGYEVRVEEAQQEGGVSNPFHQRIADLVKGEGKLFKEFSKTVAGEVDIRAQRLRSRIERSGY